MNALAVAGLVAVAQAMASAPVGEPRGEDFAQLEVRSHVVIRIRTESVDAPAPRPLATSYKERKGPRCIAMSDMAGAAVIAPGSVDLVLRTGERMRARFAASCPALDYYRGFYLAPTADAMLCAGRDVVRDRAGGECPVQAIRLLSPRK